MVHRYLRFDNLCARADIIADTKDKLDDTDVQYKWFQQDGATTYKANETLDISRLNAN